MACIHYVRVDGLTASRALSKARALAAAADAVAARPDAVVEVFRLGADARPYSMGETVAVVSTAAPVAGVRIQRFAGALNGWRDASPAVVDAATAARRLRLYRAVRGDAYIFRVSGPVLPGESAAPVLPRHGDAAPVLPVLPVLPARRNATPWHARTVPFAAVYALFAVTYAAGAVLAAHTLAAPSTEHQTVRVALR